MVVSGPVTRLFRSTFIAYEQGTRRKPHSPMQDISMFLTANPFFSIGQSMMPNLVFTGIAEAHSPCRLEKGVWRQTFARGQRHTSLRHQQAIWAAFGSPSTRQGLSAKVPAVNWPGSLTRCLELA
jgi:hypothetical protein